MRATILATEAFSYTAELRPLQHPPGAYSLAITSTFAGAKAPAVERQLFQASLGLDGLHALRGLIDQVVQP